MSVFGSRDGHEVGHGAMLHKHLTANIDGETMCGRIEERYNGCLRESQALDVQADCKSRRLDLQECTNRWKQSIWMMRENVVTIRNREAFGDWSQKFDEDFGAPSLLEGVDKVRKLVAAEGGVEVFHPTHFKDPVVY